jgi:hypothetical protein
LSTHASYWQGYSKAPSASDKNILFAIGGGENTQLRAIRKQSNQMQWEKSNPIQSMSSCHIIHKTNNEPKVSQWRNHALCAHRIAGTIATRHTAYILETQTHTTITITTTNETID